MSAPRELVIDAGDLARDAAGRLMEIFRLWGVRRAAASLTRRWVKRLGQHVLAPNFSLGLEFGSTLGWEEKEEAAQKLGERFDALVVDEAQEVERRTAGTRRPSRSSWAS